MHGESIHAFWLRAKHYICDETRTITGEVNAYGPTPDQLSDPVSGLECPDLSHPGR